MPKSLDRRISRMETMLDAMMRFQIAVLAFQGLSERRIAKKLGIPRWVVRSLGDTV